MRIDVFHSASLYSSAFEKQYFNKDAERALSIAMFIAIRFIGRFALLDEGHHMNPKPHHIGCAVREMESSVATYADAFGLHKRTRSIDVASQGVSVCFLELGERFYMELVTPLAADARLAAYFEVGFYHLCFLAEDLQAMRSRLKAQQFSPLPAFSSEAFGGALCQFFVSPQLHLIELAQMSSQDFDRFFAENLSY